MRMLFRAWSGSGPSAVRTGGTNSTTTGCGCPTWASSPGGAGGASSERPAPATVRPCRTHRLLGMADYRHLQFGLGDLLRPTPDDDDGPTLGNVSWTSLSSGPDGQVRRAVSAGVFLVTDGDTAAAEGPRCSPPTRRTTTGWRQRGPPGRGARGASRHAQRDDTDAARGRLPPRSAERVIGKRLSVVCVEVGGSDDSRAGAGSIA